MTESVNQLKFRHSLVRSAGCICAYPFALSLSKHSGNLECFEGCVIPVGQAQRERTAALVRITTPHLVRTKQSLGWGVGLATVVPMLGGATPPLFFGPGDL